MGISILERTEIANVVVRAAIRHEGRYLVVQEGKDFCYGKYSFVGGKLDEGEFITEGVLREVAEETGVTAELLGILGVRHSLWEDGEGFTFEFFFLAEAATVPEEFPLSDEIIGVSWKTVEELAALREAGEFRNASQEQIVELLGSDAVLPLSHIQQTVSGSRLAGNREIAASGTVNN